MRKTSNTRENIKESAILAGISLLDKHGMEAFSARKVATEINYTVGTLYNAFDDFEDLILHINAATLAEMHNALAKLASGKSQGMKRILDFAHYYSDYATAHPARWNLLHNAQRSKALPAWYRREIDRIFLLVEDSLKELYGNKTLKLNNAARILWAGLHGICALNLNQKLETVRGGSTDALIEDFVKNYLNGLGHPKF